MLRTYASTSDHDDLHIRIIGTLVILLTSAFGALLPLLLKHRMSGSKDGKLQQTILPAFFDFTKYLGSGVIISTAFVHLLSPAFETLRDPNLPGIWQQIDMAPLIAMTAVFAIFTVELLASRVGTSWLQSMGIAYEHHDPAHSAHGPCENNEREAHNIVDDLIDDDAQVLTDDEAEHVPILQRHQFNGLPLSHSAPAILRNFSAERRQLYCVYGTSGHSKKSAETITRKPSAQSLSSHGNNKISVKATQQILGVAVLEFGVLLHSFVIGLTLAVVKRFAPLAFVITLHQTFEGLGLGARLANIDLPKKHRWLTIAAGVLYGAITPLGMVIGLSVRNSYSPNSPTALVVSGVLDALSAGVLLYTGLVELLAAEFLFHPEMKEAPTGKVLYALSCVILGAVVMAVLGIWV